MRKLFFALAVMWTFAVSLGGVACVIGMRGIWSIFDLFLVFPLAISGPVAVSLYLFGVTGVTGWFYGAGVLILAVTPLMLASWLNMEDYDRKCSPAKSKKYRYDDDDY